MSIWVHKYVRLRPKPWKQQHQRPARVATRFMNTTHSRHPFYISTYLNRFKVELNQLDTHTWLQKKLVASCFELQQDYTRLLHYLSI